MTKEELQTAIDKTEIEVKILLVKKTELDDYEIIFTRDLGYDVSSEELISRENIREPEEDVLADNLEDAIIEIKYQLLKTAWYK